MFSAFIQRIRCTLLSPLSIAICIALTIPVIAFGQLTQPTASPVPVTKSKAPAAAQSAAAVDPRFNQHAHGSFDVKITPIALYDKTAPPTLGRRAVEKHFHGELEGVSRGEMLTAKTSVDGSEAYVAMEYVVASLKGRKGTFILQHRGLMTKGKLDLVLNVVPDSGTGDLAGIDGSFTIDIAGGKHFYDFAYKLPAKK